MIEYNALRFIEKVDLWLPVARDREVEGDRLVEVSVICCIFFGGGLRDVKILQ